MLCVAAAVASVTPVIGARQRTGSVSGILSDITGEAVPGARVVLVAENQPVREAITNSLGRYTIDSLPPGRYRIEAHLAGFETKVSAISVMAKEVADWSVRGLRIGGRGKEDRLGLASAG